MRKRKGEAEEEKSRYNYGGGAGKERQRTSSYRKTLLSDEREREVSRIKQQAVYSQKPQLRSWEDGKSKTKAEVHGQQLLLIPMWLCGGIVSVACQH